MPRAKQKPPDGALYVEDVETPNNFVMVPFMIADDLKPYDLAVYIQIRRRASERPGGACFRSNHGLAKDVGCSVSQVKKSRAVLEERGLIKVTYQRDENGIINAPPVVTIVSVWAENYRRYTKGDNRNHPGDIVTTPGDIVAAGRLPTDTKEESVEQEPSKKKKKDANASSVPATEKPKAKANSKKKPTRSPEEHAAHDALQVAIASAFKYEADRIPSEVKSLIAVTAWKLLDTRYLPGHVPHIFRYCRDKLSTFTVAALSKYAADARNALIETYGRDIVEQPFVIDDAAEGTPPEFSEDEPPPGAVLHNIEDLWDRIAEDIDGARVAGKR